MPREDGQQQTPCETDHLKLKKKKEKEIILYYIRYLKKVKLTLKYKYLQKYL